MIRSMTDAGGGEFALGRSTSRLVDILTDPTLDTDDTRGGCGSGTSPGMEGFRWKTVLGIMGSPDNHRRNRPTMSLGLSKPELGRRSTGCSGSTLGT